MEEMIVDQSLAVPPEREYQKAPVVLQPVRAHDRLFDGSVKDRFKLFQLAINRIDNLLLSPDDVSKPSGQQQIDFQNDDQQQEILLQPARNQIEERQITRSEQQAASELQEDSDELESSCSDEDWTKKKARRGNALLSKRKSICKQKSPVERRQINLVMNLQGEKQKATATPWTKNDFCRLLQGVKLLGKNYKPLSDFMKDRSDQAIRIKMQKVIRDYAAGKPQDDVLRQIAELSTRKVALENLSQNANGVSF